VVGSRMVIAIEQSNDDNLLSNIAQLTQELRVAIDS
jgi:tryptophan synthase alpha chain